MEKEYITLNDFYNKKNFQQEICDNKKLMLELLEKEEITQEDYEENKQIKT